MTRQSSPIVEFITARLAEDEQAARGTKQASMSWQNFDMDGELRDDANAGTVAFIPQEADRAHIARHDPARVLREVEAKRQLLDEHSITNDSVCSTCVTGKWGYPAHGGADPQPYPCRTLRLLAQRDADHRDFDPAWSTE